MLVVVSDLHMTDRTTGQSVTDAELTGFVQELMALEPRDEPLTLLLLGDIVDLLRSEQWDTLWAMDHGAAPWSGLGRQFEGFEDGLQEQTLLQIVAGIDRKYPTFFAALANLKTARQVQIQYVIGNHDFMLQLSPKARTEIVRMFSLDQPAAEFPLEYLDEALDLYADHGHRHDEVNYHQRNTARWALGDGIVLRIVNEFTRAARRELHLTSATPLGKAVDEIDNVEPTYHIPLYVHWLATAKLVSTGEQETLRDAWRRTVSSFLALDYFREDRYGTEARAIGWMRALYKTVDLDALLQHLRSVPFSLTRNGHMEQGYLVKTSAALRVFGHTHAPAVVALPKMIGGRRGFYVNTGTWRTIRSHVTVPADGPVLDFASHRVSTYLIVRGPGQFELTRRTRCP